MSATASATCRKAWQWRLHRRVAMASGYGARAPEPRAALRQRGLGGGRGRELSDQALLRPRLGADAKRHGHSLPAALGRARPTASLSRTRSPAASLHETPPATSRNRDPHEPPPPPTPWRCRRARSVDAPAPMRGDRRAVEAAISERYGRIEQPPPGHAHADEQKQEVDPGGVLRVRRSVLPTVAPTEGGPPPPAIPAPAQRSRRGGKPRQ